MSITNVFDTGYTNHIDADAHPNGKSIYLAINKTEAKDRTNYYNLKIVEVNRATRKVVRIIKEYNQGVQTFGGPMGYCTVQCLPDGALFVGLAMPSAKDPSQIVAAIDIIENVIPLFTPGSTNTTNPPPPAQLIDADARAQAAQAYAEALRATSAAKTAQTNVMLLDGTLAETALELRTRLAALPTKDYVWQNIADRIALEIKNTTTGASSVFESPLFISFVKSKAQEVLLDAINYAGTSPDKSSLRTLIVSIIRQELGK